jgi:6-phosphogluconate dehydrogenase
MQKKYSLGMIGLGVMGRSLALNFQRNGYTVAGYDISPKLASLVSDENSYRAGTLQDLAMSLESPRVIIIMVPAGAPVDGVITGIRPFLNPGDILIDGGNSFFLDTERRIKELQDQAVHFVGMGVSGGESGALWGPSLMPGGAETAWLTIRPMLEAIAAKASDGAPCVAWMGSGGAGHFVKMVHNGIEYADMQLIAETYDVLYRGAGLSSLELSDVFAGWNQGKLESFLIEITAKIFSRHDEASGIPLVELILDEAAQKGTGKWTSQVAMDVGVATPTINAAVEARLLSSLKEERLEASKALGGSQVYSGEKQQLLTIMEQAMYASKICAYAQGFTLLFRSSIEYDWGLDLSAIARVWRAGCIIRAAILEDIVSAFTRHDKLPNLMLDQVFQEEILDDQLAWREVVKIGVELGLPMLATGASLSYFDAYRSGRLPANLIQAQRDYFGAHTYRRIDQPGIFHTDWE